MARVCLKFEERDREECRQEGWWEGAAQTSKSTGRVQSWAQHCTMESKIICRKNLPDLDNDLPSLLLCFNKYYVSTYAWNTKVTNENKTDLVLVRGASAAVRETHRARRGPTPQNKAAIFPKTHQTQDIVLSPWGPSHPVARFPTETNQPAGA